MVKEESLETLLNRRNQIKQEIVDLSYEIKLFGNSSNRLGILNKMKFNLCNLNKDIENNKYHE